MPRRKPYTAIGIRRLRCIRCGDQAKYQWQICADGNTWRPICAECDYELNKLVMLWMFGNTRDDAIEKYRKRLGL